MYRGFDDFEIVVEPCPMTSRIGAWIWSVGRREDGVLSCGRSYGGRAEACRDAAIAAFRLLGIDIPPSPPQVPSRPYRITHTGTGT